jgi:hypothetical protein
MSEIPKIPPFQMKGESEKLVRNSRAYFNRNLRAIDGKINAEKVIYTIIILILIILLILNIQANDEIQNQSKLIQKLELQIDDRNSKETRIYNANYDEFITKYLNLKEKERQAIQTEINNQKASNEK